MKQPLLVLHSSKQVQSELFLKILYFEDKPRLYLSLLMMTLLFLSFVEFTQLFIVPALVLISEL